MYKDYQFNQITFESIYEPCKMVIKLNWIKQRIYHLISNTTQRTQKNIANKRSLARLKCYSFSNKMFPVRGFFAHACVLWFLSIRKFIQNCYMGFLYQKWERLEALPINGQNEIINILFSCMDTRYLFLWFYPGVMSYWVLGIYLVHIIF